MKKIFAFVLALVLTLSLAACGGEGSGNTTTAPSADAPYRVTVTDASGNPYTEGVIVRFLHNGQQVAMQLVDAQGVAEKKLERGDYTVELVFTDTDASYYYDQSDLNLTAEKTELAITLSFGAVETGRTIYAGGEEHATWAVTVGGTYVKLNPGKRTYFLFTPNQAGTYRISCEEAGTAVGYYGAPHFVQDLSVAEVVDNAFDVSVRADMIGTGDTGTTVLVIGVDSESAQQAVLNIERTGDPEYSVEDEPWTVYQPTSKLENYKLPAGAKLKDFDLTAKEAYNLVLNEEDGFYHLNSADGPLVLVRLGVKSGGSKYLDCFETIIGKSGVTKYFYDENGEFVKKESYTECLSKYIGYQDQSTMEKHAGCMDPDTGLYPLTEDLKYIIQQRGDYVGWWDLGAGMYLFAELPGLNAENAWLFMCCYIDG